MGPFAAKKSMHPELLTLEYRSDDGSLELHISPAKMTATPTNLSALLAQKLAAQQTSGPDNTCEPEDSREVPGSAPWAHREAQLQAQIDGLYENMRIDRQFREAGLVSAFRKILKELTAEGEFEVSKSLEDSRQFIDNAARELDTSAAASRVTEALKDILTTWLDDLESDRNWATHWHRESAQWVKVLEDLDKHREIILALPAQESCYLHGARSASAERRRLLTEVTAQLAHAQELIALAECALGSEPTPDLLQAAFRVARKACREVKGTADWLQDNFYQFQKEVVSAQGYLQYELERRESVAAQESARQARTYSNTSSAPPQAGLPVQSSSTCSTYVPEEEPFDPYPAFNWASGLPMQGRGSPFDMGGNVFGTNNDNFNDF